VTVVELGPPTPDSAHQCGVTGPTNASELVLRAEDGREWRILSVIPGRQDDILAPGERVSLFASAHAVDDTYSQTVVIARDGELVWFAEMATGLPELQLHEYDLDLGLGAAYCWIADECGGYRHSALVSSSGEQVEVRAGETGRAGRVSVSVDAIITGSSCKFYNGTRVGGFVDTSEPDPSGPR
jgi:hypothetical protein